MKLRVNRFEIAFCKWELPYSFICTEIRPHVRGLSIAIHNLFEFWICWDYNKYDKDGFLIL